MSNGGTLRKGKGKRARGINPWITKTCLRDFQIFLTFQESLFWFQDCSMHQNGLLKVMVQV